LLFRHHELASWKYRARVVIHMSRTMTRRQNVEKTIAFSHSIH
jgi:hypothetical protein